MKPQPSVILFYDHVAKLSGGEIFLWHLISNFDREKFRPVVVLGEDGPLREKIQEAGIETYVLALPNSVVDTRKGDLGKRGLIKKLGSVFGTLPYIWRLRTLIRRYKADIVHTNSLKADIIGGIAGRMAGKPVVWHVHDCIDTQYLPSAAVRLFRGLARRLPTHVISVSQAVETTLCLPPKANSTVIHNGIPWLDTPQRQPCIQNKGPVVGIVGRITRWKGQHIFIRAAAILHERFPTVRFQIVGGALFGEDNYWQEIHDLVDQLNLKEVVEFLGFRNDVSALLSNFDVFVHASTSPEPFGIVIIEAMREGKAVVATRGGGVPEIICDNVTGLLVPMNDVEALAEAIALLLDDPEKRQRMGEAGIEHVKNHFLINNSVQKVESVYRQILTLPAQ